MIFNALSQTPRTTLVPVQRSLESPRGVPTNLGSILEWTENKKATPKEVACAKEAG